MTLGLNVYKVDLSSVVSKYIGETEKNLARIFAEAETSNSILFFDEADALFGKRTEVSNAHDRYANIETSYLLQKMEEQEGVVILATNLRQNMDEAFTRRMRFIVEFPFPEADSRLRIWRTLFPATGPVSSEIDFAYLAREFPVAGGSIKNIVLNAAFLAAADGGIIGTRHILQGTRREFEKIGKLWSEPSSSSEPATTRKRTDDADDSRKSDSPGARQISGGRSHVPDEVNGDFQGDLRRCCWHDRRLSEQAQDLARGVCGVWAEPAPVGGGVPVQPVAAQPQPQPEASPFRESRVHASRHSVHSGVAAADPAGVPWPGTRTCSSCRISSSSRWRSRRSGSTSGWMPPTS